MRRAPDSMATEDPAPLVAWATSVLALGGASVTGSPRLRRRNWSLVVEIPTTAGSFWAKANAAPLAHEAALVGLLAARVPGHVLAPVALDADRGWLLLPDGGEVPGLDAEASTDEWERLFVDYAALQRRTEEIVPALLAGGVPDARPARLPEVYDLVVSRCDVPELTGALTRLAPVARRLAEILDDSPVPPSVEHNDVHLDNVFRGESLRLFDWGDSLVTHPFVCTVSISDAASDAVTRERLRDSYLDGFADLAPLPALRRDADAASALAYVLRASIWSPHFYDEEGRYRHYFVQDLRRTVEALSGVA